MTRPPDASDDALTDRILGRAVEVHRRLGRHQPERMYRDGLAAGLEEEELAVETEAEFDIEMYDKRIGTAHVDLLVERAVALELKAVRSTNDDHFWQLARNVRASPANRGLLLNFGASTLDIRRYVAGDADG